MHEFAYKRDQLCCEGLPVKDLAKKFATPLYVYSAKTVLDHFLKIKKAFAPLKPLICYSVKANSNLSILKLLVDKGAGLDIVSGGELYRAQKVKCLAKKVVYASVGKTVKEIKDAIEYGILMFNVESAPELERINDIAAELNRRVDVALRVNLDISPKTHAYIKTAKKETKFGMEPDLAKDILINQRCYPNLNMKGVHIHIGSQITEARPCVDAIKKIKALIKEVKAQGVILEYLNIGGGLGIIYDKERPQTAAKFARKVLPLLKSISLKVILEPGRFIVGNAGILVTKVLYVKNTIQKKFIIIDAGMNDLIRPSLYQAHHTIVPLSLYRRKTKGTSKKADIVGPICESADFLGKERDLDAKVGDYLAVLGAGAYGFVMSSNYNSRPRVAEVLVKGKEVKLVRKRETYKDLVAKEIIV
ncbi:MAG: diaminopimelate decarboxylase [Candidatus Omnitrophota bacterium]|nr:MAG: diaminopimelate decarboxylase [Candidatus Omnitrophota bacterium]